GERAQGGRATRRPHGRALACRHGAPHGRDRTGDRATQTGGRASLEGRNFAPSRALSRWTIGRTHIPEIRENTDIVTQITTVKVPPKNQSEVLELMAERARFMATQPGFISVCLHRSEDGSHVVNYVQWTNREKLEAAHHSPEFRKKMAALRRTHQGGGAVPLSGHLRRSGLTTRIIAGVDARP